LRINADIQNSLDDERHFGNVTELVVDFSPLEILLPLNRIHTAYKEKKKSNKG